MKKLILLSIAALLVVWRCSKPDNANETNIPTTKYASANNASLLDISEVSWNTFSSKDFHFDMPYPEGWKVAEFKTTQGAPVINVYNTAYERVSTPPFDIVEHPEISFMSIHPQGNHKPDPLGTKLSLQEWTNSLASDFKIDEAASMVYTLNDGQVWAYLLKPENPPVGWNKDGFIFLHLGVDNFTARCFDAEGRPKPLAECSLASGDKLSRYGKVREDDAKIFKHALQSFYFFGKRDKRVDINQLIRIESPKPDEKITSPVTIKGKARGYWFYEGSFPVQLKNNNLKVLLQKSIQAEGDWMTKGWVPFEMTVEYDQPSAQNGSIVFQKSNPSGLAENDRQFSLPVAFK